MRYLFLVISVFAMHPALSQEKPEAPRRNADSLRTIELQRKPQISEKQPAEEITIRDYKIVSHQRDTTFLDTTLTIAKEYRYNYLRRDDFELMPFSNVGQPYNRLGVELGKRDVYPRLGARARHFNYMETEDISYYNVATPMTDLFFKTTFEQGQMLDAMLTSNFSRRLNVSIAFKGFRSRGKYRQDEAQSGNFRVTANYLTQDGRYQFRTHLAAQDLKGQENGGLVDAEAQFESNNPDFTDRARVDVLFSNVQNELQGKRYYLDQKFRLLRGGTDSLPARGGLFLTHRFEYESKWYQYNQNTNNTAYFGPLLFTPVKDQAYLKTTFNQVGTEWNNRILGRLEAFVSLYDYSYFFTSILNTGTQTIPNQLSGQQVLGGASWDKGFGGFRLQASGALGLSGDLTGSYLDASIRVPLGKKHSFTGGVHHSTRLPDFNFLLYQSDYENYNWNNSDRFSNEQVQSLFAGLRSDIWGAVRASFSSVENYTYYASVADADQIAAGEERAWVRPFQESGRLSLLRLKYEKELRWRKWALNNTVLYQQADQTGNVLNLPTFVTRNSLYFSSDVFKKAMFVQTGITFKYFTEYYMDAYNPLLADFYVQDREKLGGYPLLDFFINARVRQTRIYLKAEHFNAAFGGRNYYSAPNYPYRDFVIRFGLVWNFFS